MASLFRCAKEALRQDAIRARNAEREAHSAEKKAEEEEALAREVNDFLRNDLLALAGPASRPPGMWPPIPKSSYARYSAALPPVFRPGFRSHSSKPLSGRPSARLTPTSAITFSPVRIWKSAQIVSQGARQ